MSEIVLNGIVYELFGSESQSCDGCDLFTNDFNCELKGYNNTECFQENGKFKKVYQKQES